MNHFGQQTGYRNVYILDRQATLLDLASLFPGFSDTAAFELVCPDMRLVRKQFPTESFDVASPEDGGTLRIRARLLYRKVDQYLLNFIYGADSGLSSPITEMATASRDVGVTDQLD